MLSGEKILVTGAAGQIAFPIARELRADNEVWGLARFSKPEDRQRLVDVGIVPVKGDVGSGEFADLPTDFTYVVHLAANQAPGWDYDTALRDNAEGTGCCFSTAGMYVEHW